MEPRARNLLLVLLVAFVGCEDPAELSVSTCTEDAECGTGQFCNLGECAPPSSIACAAVEGGEALLQPSPIRLDFQDLSQGPERTITVRNIGSCTLTLFEASIEGEVGRFTCPDCDEQNFPLEIFPFREEPLTVRADVDEVGVFEAAVVLLSDDEEFPEIRIPIVARFDGLPVARVVPEALQFGYASVGRTVQRTVLITNQGTGTAPLSIADISVVPADSSFSRTTGGAYPLDILPFEDNPTAVHAVQVRYAPTSAVASEAELVIETETETLRLPLSGTAESPPMISASPEVIDFGPIPIGDTATRLITIQNAGAADLSYAPRLSGQAGRSEFWIEPASPGAIASGAFAEIAVRVAPATTTELNDLLVLQSNAPDRPTLSIPLSAVGVEVPGAEVVHIDMHYDNGSDTAFDEDLRDVDLALENPLGQVCDESTPAPGDWNVYGNPKWIAFAPHEEPERVLLPNAMQDGTYRVLVRYIEDCSSVPTTLVATVLGISLDALVSYYSGGVINIPADRVAEVIDDLCVSRSSTQVTVTVRINGNIILEAPVQLQRKGDYRYAIELIRQDGTFVVR